MLQRFAKAGSGMGCLLIFPGLVERRFSSRVGNNCGIGAALSHAGRVRREQPIRNFETFSAYSSPRLDGINTHMDSVSPLHLLTRTHLLVVLIVWAISIVYMATHLKLGWVPHDEGTLGLSADRVWDGELPHPDFDDYTR